MTIEEQLAEARARCDEAAARIAVTERDIAATAYQLDVLEVEYQARAELWRELWATLALPEIEERIDPARGTHQPFGPSGYDDDYDWGEDDEEWVSGSTEHER